MKTEARALRDAGCDLLQGTHFGQPMPFDRLLALPGVTRAPVPARLPEPAGIASPGALRPPA